MTPIFLLEELKKFIERETKDLLLPVRVSKESGKTRERAAEVHIMRLPTPDAETKRIPYVLLQFVKCTDDQREGQSPESMAMVRIVAATYSEDSAEGALYVLNLLSRIRTALLKDGVIGEQFMHRPPLEMIVYTDSTPPYYIGEMMTTWQMPPIESEVQDLWQ